MTSSMDNSTLQPSMRTSASMLRHQARGRRGCLPSSGDTTELLSQQSEAFDVSIDQGVYPDLPPSPMGTQEFVNTQARKRRGTPRELVNEEHLCTLVAAYNVHFEKYSAGKSNVTQVIPSHVWKNTYATYKQAYPSSIFKQDSLKERLRDTLKELKAGNNNEENSERASLQCNQVMEALRCTNGHAKRNVLRKRHSILKSTVSATQGISEGSDESDFLDLSLSPTDTREPPATPCTPPKNKRPKEMSKENVNPTKAQMLYKQSASIENIAKTYQRSTSKRDALVELKIASNEAKHTKTRIDNLKTTKEHGVILEEEFKYYSTSRSMCTNVPESEANHTLGLKQSEIDWLETRYCDKWSHLIVGKELDCLLWSCYDITCSTDD